MIKERLSRIIEQKKTILGVGPMSTNCIDAVVELSNEHDVPILLIASRRQIDAEEFGGGYVNNWTTNQLAEYVLARDYGGKVLLCRDHGGPWQSIVEQKNDMGLRAAMESAKLSFRRDIEAGFQIIHIDPSVDIHSHPSMDEIVDRVLELYEYCWETAVQNNRRIEFEIGTEEQSGSTSSAVEFENMLKRVNRHCDKYHMPRPLFVVVQNGTKVSEMRNIGSFDMPVRVAGEIAPEIQIPLMADICRKNDVFIKAHNTDYLSDESLHWYPRLGIHAANIAPEFGVVETRTLLKILEDSGLNQMAEEFIQLAYESRKWEKWMARYTKATDRDRAMIAGHYVFSTPQCMELKKRAQMQLDKVGINLNESLKNEVKLSIQRYLYDFRMITR